MHVMTRRRRWILPLLAAVGLGQAAPDHRLADAAERRDLPAVRALLKQGADVNVSQPDGATALHWAAHWDDLDAADALVKARANVNAANDHGVTPLALAAENGNVAMVEKLLGAGANPNAAVGTGEPVLMTAARAGSTHVVRALLAQGANVNAKEPTHGQTALMWAAANGHADVLTLLLEAGADIRARSDARPRIVHTGNRYGDRGADKGVVRMEMGGFTPLLFAARQGDERVAVVLLAKGADVNDQAANGTSALVLAAHSGHSALAAMFLEKGANPNADAAGYTALHAAVLRGDLPLVRVLLGRGVDPNVRLKRGTPSRYYSKDWALNDVALTGSTPFWQAARYGDIPIMRALAAAGADPKFTMPDGTTSLMTAIVANSGFGTGDRRERYLGPGDIAPTLEENERLTREAAALALELGADLHAVNTAGDTALHLAASQALSSVVQLLVDKGANLEAVNKRKLTPLGVALVPRPPSPLQIEGPDRRKGTADLLRTLGAKEPDPAVVKPR